ncbi:MAG: hypothetical protein NC186_04240 [Prevotella sp.]|nr:hypothetical protein [Prevotella sp.]MCM1474717.1 hypothetical protein [Muribaculaceae bacterium]
MSWKVLNSIYIAATMTMVAGNFAVAQNEAPIVDSEVIDEYVRITDPQLEEACRDLRNFRISAAEKKIAAFRKGGNRNDEWLQFVADSLQEKIPITRQALQHVQQIVVIDSLEVSREDFFKHYRIPSSCGKMLSIAEIPGLADDARLHDHALGAEMAFGNESGDFYMWTLPDSAYNLNIVESTRLLGGEWEAPQPVPEKLGMGRESIYPFLTSDGTTLYYSSNGDDSMGGYDIFMATRDPQTGEYLDPINLGMPINSPANEYLMAIDDENGVGWWATDRNSDTADSETLTIYIYILPEVRENIDPESENLITLASLSDYKATWPEGSDYSDLLRTVRAIQPDSGEEPDFHFRAGGGKVYRYYSELPTEEARQAMEKYQTAKKSLETTLQELAELRIDFHRTHSRQTVGRIRDIESQLDKQQQKVAKLRNAVYKQLRWK